MVEKYFNLNLYNFKSTDSLDYMKKLGEGSFGSAYLCRNEVSNKLLVMKKSLINDSDIYRDILFHCRFRYCERSVKYLGLYNDNGAICIAMDYFKGGSLVSYMNGKGVSELEIARICYSLLLQIGEIHSNKTIHRDIKPDNVVLDDQLNAKLIDFGLSKCMQNLSTEKQMENLRAYKPGTLCYMAPEILNRKPYTEKIDIWSFGAMVIEMITGRRPYSNLTPIQAAIRVAKTKIIEFEHSTSISEELTSFLNSCLRPDPLERASAKELVKSAFIRKHCSQLISNA